MKAITTLCLFVFIVAFSNQVIAQETVVFEYDNAGNRILRTLQAIEKNLEADILHFENPFTEINIELHAKVYPNPTQGILNIEINLAETLPVTITLVDQQARQVLKTEISENAETLNLAHLAPGTYFLRLHNTEKKLVYQIIKQ
jgi:hypothetical protein